MNHYKELAAIDVSKYVEKKGPHKLDYLSWAVAVDFLMKADPTATWQFNDPQCFAETLMVSCTVTAFGKPITMHLPVMDHTNKAVKNPDAFIVNKNMMRCLVKAIACHGLGISVYAGEDLPNEEPAKEVKVAETVIVDNITAINEAENIDELKKIFTVAHSVMGSDREAIARITAAKDKRKAELQA
jgi:Fe2+ transport system protein B